MANPLRYIRKVLNPFGGYEDAPDYTRPMGSDTPETGGFTGQGKLYDTPDSSDVMGTPDLPDASSYSNSPRNYSSPRNTDSTDTTDTTDSFPYSTSPVDSNPYSDSGSDFSPSSPSRPVKSAESATIPFPSAPAPRRSDLQTMNIPMPFGDRSPGSPPGYTAGAGISRPTQNLYGDMPVPQTYTEAQTAVHDPALNPHSPMWRQILGGLAEHMASGILSPLGDTIRYGPKGATALHDAQYRLAMTKQAQLDQLAQARQSEAEANAAAVREQAKANAADREFYRNQTLYNQMGRAAETNQGKWETNTLKAGGVPVPEAFDIPATTGYAPAPSPAPIAPVNPPPSPGFTGPIRPSNLGPNGETIPSPPPPTPPGGPDISSLPTKTFDPGAYISPRGMVPQNYRFSAAPSTVEMQSTGVPRMIPARESEGMMIPPSALVAQQKQEALQADWPTVPKELAEQIGLPSVANLKVQPAHFIEMLKMAVTKDPTSVGALALTVARSGGGTEAEIAQRALNIWTQHTLAGRPVTNNNLYSGMPPASSTATGSDFLALLPLELKSQVQGIVDGDIRYPPASQRGGNQNTLSNQLRGYAGRVDPHINEGRFTVKQSFKDAQKNAGGSINSADTLISHIGALYDLTRALQKSGGRTDIPAVNSFVNFVQTQLGHPEVTNLETALTAVSNEAERLFRQTGTSKAGIDSWKAAMDTVKASPAQGTGKIKTLLKILGGRTGELASTFRRGMDRRDAEGKSVTNDVDEQFIDNFFSPQARSTLEKMGVDPGTLLGRVSESGTSGGRTAPTAQAPSTIPTRTAVQTAPTVPTVPTVRSVEEYNALPNGANYIDPSDGQTYTKGKKAKKAQ